MSIADTRFDYTHDPAASPGTNKAFSRLRTLVNTLLATDLGTLSSDLTAHIADSTAVHGITDTAQLPYKNAANTFTLDQTAPRWISTIATGTSPLGITSTTRVDNLTAHYLGAASQDSAYHLDRTNHTGTQGWATITGTPTTLAGYGITDAASDAELATHAADTTAVHGITDTADLALVSLLTTDFGYTIPITNIDPNQSSKVLLWDSGGGWAGASFGASNTVLVGQGTTTNPAFAQIFDAQIAGAAAIEWSKISKTGSSLADLSTKSAGALDSGNLAAARLPTGSVTWAMSSITLAPTAGRLIINTASGQDLMEGQVAGVRAFLITGSARFNWADTSTGTLDLRAYRSAASVMTIDNAGGGAAKLHLLGEFECDGAFNHDGSTFGALNTAPAAKQTVTGSRGGNAALASLITAMATFGFVTDSSTA